jgi:hypothetical protein
MATFTIEQDKIVRAQLHALATEFRKRYQGTAYQGDYENTANDETFGDRLQVPTKYKAKTGERYLLVMNLLVARNRGGALSARVSAWSITTGDLLGTWPVTSSDTSKKGGRLYHTYLTPNGFIEKIGSNKVHFDIVRRLPHVLNDAKTLLDAGITGRPVVTEHGYGPDHALYGETYDTTESHLLPFGGYDGGYALLSK